MRSNKVFLSIVAAVACCVHVGSVRAEPAMTEYVDLDTEDANALAEIPPEQLLDIIEYTDMGSAQSQSSAAATQLNAPDYNYNSSQFSMTDPSSSAGTPSLSNTSTMYLGAESSADSLGVDTQVYASAFSSSSATTVVVPVMVVPTATTLPGLTFEDLLTISTYYGDPPAKTDPPTDKTGTPVGNPTPTPQPCKSYERPCPDKDNKVKCCLNELMCAKNPDQTQISCAARCAPGTVQCVGRTSEPNQFECCKANQSCTYVKPDTKKDSPYTVAKCVDNDPGDKPAPPGGQTCFFGGNTWLCKVTETCGKFGSKQPCCGANHYFDLTKGFCVQVGTKPCTDIYGQPPKFDYCRDSSSCCAFTVGKDKKMDCCNYAEECNPGGQQVGCKTKDPVPPAPPPGPTIAWVTPIVPKVCTMTIYTDKACIPCIDLKKKLTALKIPYTEVEETVDQRPHPRVVITCNGKSDTYFGLSNAQIAQVQAGTLPTQEK